MISGGGANVYARNYLRSDPLGDFACVRKVRADPDRSYRCTRTIAVCGEHECRVNGVTHEVYDRHCGTLRYVGASVGDDDVDISVWRSWLISSGGAA